MTTNEKTYWTIMSAQNDKNISFRDVRNLLESIGFECRIKGDYYIFSYPGMQENINIQPDGKTAKPYQIRQIRHYLGEYQIGMEE